MKPWIVITAFVFQTTIIIAADKGPTLGEARAKYKAADAELNKAYAAAIAELDKSKAAALREDERNWIQFRDELVDADLPVSDEPATNDPEHWESLTQFAQDRAVFLRAYSGKHVPAGISGEYSDCYGGTLEMKPAKDGVDFSLEAVRGRSHNQGEISGTIQFKGNTAYFKQKAEDAGQDNPPCELVFSFVDGHIIKIVEKVPDSTAGAGVHYDGDYYKTGKLREN